MRNGFCDEYKCVVDAKGRLFIPAKMREQFKEGEQVILARSLDSCVSVYTEEKWKGFEEKIDSLPSTEARDVKRFFYGSMQETELDPQGRVLLPLRLREFASIQKQVVVVGCGDHAEIWDEDNYRVKLSETKTETVEEILRRNGL